jgi:hypothetical protein
MKHRTVGHGVVVGVASGVRDRRNRTLVPAFVAIALVDPSWTRYVVLTLRAVVGVRADLQKWSEVTIVEPELQWVRR